MKHLMAGMVFCFSAHGLTFAAAAQESKTAKKSSITPESPQRTLAGPIAYNIACAQHKADNGVREKKIQHSVQHHAQLKELEALIEKRVQSLLLVDLNNPNKTAPWYKSDEEPSVVVADAPVYLADKEAEKREHSTSRGFAALKKEEKIKKSEIVNSNILMGRYCPSVLKEDFLLRKLYAKKKAVRDRIENYHSTPPA